MEEIEFGSIGEPLENTQRRVRLAARALARQNLVHAYGHVSARIDENNFLVCAPRPMGLIEPGEKGTIVPVSGQLPEGVLGEVRCHQQIYAARDDVNGICRVFPRNVMTLSTFRRTPKARLGFGSYFFPEPPLWDDPLLLRSDEQATEFAETLGSARAIVMRGNGAVCVASSVEESIVMAFYLEESAITELAVIASNDEGNSACFTDAEAKVRATGTGRIYERMWDYMTAGDPER
ncbi:MAG: class II aldolase [Rhodospirillaceae bacterium]|nr:class II aldolase [Rhodospirillaceae bacterium]|tara:strand:- start:20712 stop:21416 length:705 start_codon:yes stop_codon:yes gene_type:complete